MVTVSGKSLVAMDLAKLQAFLNPLVQPDKLPEFNIKVDGREKVKSVFLKLDGIDLTIYTGAIVNLGGVKFPEISNVESLFMLFAIFGIKKAGLGQSLEVKSMDQAVNDLKADTEFQFLAGKLNLFIDKFNALPTPQSVQAPEPVSESSTTKQVGTPPESKPKAKKASKAVAGQSPYKDMPIDQTPFDLVQVPEGLDLRNV